MIIYGRNAKTISSYALVFAQLFFVAKNGEIEEIIYKFVTSIVCNLLLRQIALNKPMHFSDNRSCYYMWHKYCSLIVIYN